MEEDIKILENLIEKNIKSRLRTELNANELQAIEHLIARNKELEHKLQIKSKLMSEKDLDNIIQNSVSDYDCLIEKLYKFFGYYQDPFMNEENSNHIPRID